MSSLLLGTSLKTKLVTDKVVVVDFAGIVESEENCSYVYCAFGQQMLYVYIRFKWLEMISGPWQMDDYGILMVHMLPNCILLTYEPLQPFS